MLVATQPVAALQAAPSPSSSATAPGTRATTAPAAAAPTGSLELKVRRLPDSLELVIEGVGAAPQLQQSLQGGQWQGQLRTSRPLALRQGAQRLALPELGVDTVSLSGAGQNFQLMLQPVQGFPVQRPVISSDGRDLILSFPAAPQLGLQVGRFDLTRPARLPQPAVAPPLQPRAVAPPLGDMAVGSMLLRNRGYVPLSGPPVTLTARAASARDLLFSLAQIGGYGFAYQEQASASGPAAAAGSAPSAAPTPGACGQAPPPPALQMAQGGQGSGLVFVPCPVTVQFRNEPYERAFNFVLAMAGLQAQKLGNTILVGPHALSQSIGNQLSKVYRLNQVSANGASQYLASLGAVINVPNVTTQTTSSGSSTNTGAGAASGGSTASNTSSSTSTSTFIQTYGSATGPLQGLTGTIDSRLSTITLVGDSAVVAIAEQYLRQLDLRQRQVALSVKILDVNLDNDASLSNSFAFRWGNNFIVNDGGQLLGAFGQNLPPTYNSLTGFSPLAANPGAAYPQDSFVDFLRAQILSSSTKVLASPTLVIQEDSSPIAGSSGADSAADSEESASGGNGLDSYSITSPIGRRRGNEAAVRVGTNVVTQLKVNTSSVSNTITCAPSLSTAGLVLGARVDKIDDNGFVTFGLSPSISAVTGREYVRGCEAYINILSVRRLDTGLVRVRDGQTLILTGVISDFDRAEVRKWPILGDIPLIGQFFRSSGNKREKRELVILVTPRIINDDQGGTYGYGYQPAGQDSRLLMSSPGATP